ncbi:MAG: class I SAM-dependent DNA methyltransferase, partial [Gammaproteobacteria bacterium]
YGIELEEFPAQIAQVAMWLVDHQMNMRASVEFGLYFARIPLTTAANIAHGNALQMDWRNVVAAERVDFVMGNPPFVGKNFQTKTQKAEMQSLSGGKSIASLDYVCAWYFKTKELLEDNPCIEAAFVSTNSITQGEQVPTFWTPLLEAGVKINFAHRTFAWNNEAKGVAAVHCVIIGFGVRERAEKRLFTYADIKSDPVEITAAKINPYLVDAENVVLENRREPLCPVTPMLFGSKPADGGYLLLSENEKAELLKQEPRAKPYIKKYLNADEFLYNKPRYCLWLVDCPPHELRKMPQVMARVQQVKKMRTASPKIPTQKLAATPAVFAEIRQSKSKYLLVPRVTSEHRVYIPAGYVQSSHICGDANIQIPNATLYDFGVFTSLMHMAWMRAVCGRLESRYRYSAKIVYNNFPWPKNPTAKQTADIKTAAQAVLNARDLFPDSTLADLYDPAAMPPRLLKAHQKLDKTVDRAYRPAAFPTEAARVAFLFDLYQQYTAPAIDPAQGKRARAGMKKGL